jgi:hypothetical protein
MWERTSGPEKQYVSQEAVSAQYHRSSPMLDLDQSRTRQVMSGSVGNNRSERESVRG